MLELSRQCGSRKLMQIFENIGLGNLNETCHREWRNDDECERGKA